MIGVIAADRLIGRTAKHPGQDVTEFILDNGLVAVAVWSYGATLVEVELTDKNGDRNNIVLRLPDLEAYENLENRAYVGTTLGRFARLVADGAFTLDGRLHQLTRNADKHHIHGGEQGFDTRVWDGRAMGGSEIGRVVLTLVSPDGDQGYPGTLTATTTYELDVHNRLVVEFTAQTDSPTLCGLSSHVFWNLAGEPTIDGHTLQLAAHRMLETDAEFVPTGRVLPVNGTNLDFAEPRLLSGSKIDACLALAETGQPAAVLRHPGTEHSLVVRTDQPGMAVYTGDQLPSRPRAGICLQPGAWPDAPNHPGFPTAVLRPGQFYRNRTTFDVFLTGEGGSG